MLDAGVIREINRDSDHTIRTAIMLAVIVVVVLLLALHGDRTRRALAPR